jgi:hypothetical protein
MKKVEIYRTIQDTLAEDYNNPGRIANIIRKWLDDSEEGMFIEQYTKKPIEVVRYYNPSDFRTQIMIYAYFDEKIETFWRLKFK